MNAMQGQQRLQRQSRARADLLKMRPQDPMGINHALRAWAAPLRVRIFPRAAYL